MSKVLAIIFAGGTGVRMGGSKPKQFLEVNGRPIIIHTLDIFEDSPLVDEIYIACREEYISKLQKLLTRYDITKARAVVPGGSTALESTYEALKKASESNNDDAIVLIHDGVRACIEGDLIEQVTDLVKEKSAVVTCTPLFETPVISKSGDYVEEIPARSDCYTAQAPQGFRLGEILEAFEKVRTDNPNFEGLVDSCSLMRSQGKEVAILKGPRSNIKVTTPEDLYIFKAMLEYKSNRDTLEVTD